MGEHILTVSNFYPPRAIGGAEIVAHRHALLLRKRGWTVSVFAGVLPSAEFQPGTVHIEQLDGIEVTLIGLRSLNADDNFRWGLADSVLRATIARTRPDWVHAHNIMGLGVDLIAVAKDAGVRVAVTLHDNWGYCLKNTRLRNEGTLCQDTDECHLCKPTIRAGERQLPIRLRKDYVVHRLREADLLISPSHDLARRYAEGGFPLEAIRVLSNGIDVARVPARIRRPRPEIRFLCAAYMGEHKGIPVLLDAVKHLRNDAELDGRWSLTIAGQGHLSAMVAGRIAAEGWGNVTFVGHRPREDVLKLVFDSDVVVLPSIWPENEPVILLEAIASGAPVIASGLGGNIDLVRDQQGGILVEPGDAKALAAAMRLFMTDSTLLNRFSTANAALRDTIDEELTANQLHTWFGESLPNLLPAEPVLICAGTHTLQSTVMLSLFAKLVPGVRLIWHEWARPADWEAAHGFWHWSQPNITELEPALRRGLPIIAPDAPAMQVLDGSGGPRVHPYPDLRAFWPIVKVLCHAPRCRDMKASSVNRFLIQLHDTSHFAAVQS